MAPQLRHGLQASVEGLAAATPQGIALGAALGVGLDSVLVFLASLLRESRCRVVLFTDQTPDSKALEAEGIDARRVTFERLPSLPSPWNSLDISSVQYWLFQDFLKRTSAVSAYSFVQISDVEDVAFQADPFGWVAKQPPGVHAFGDELGRVIGAGVATDKVLRQCYGNAVASRLSGQVDLPAGYVIGSLVHVQQYLQRVVDDLQAHTACNRQGIGAGVHNVVMRGPTAGFIVHVHTNHQGPVWTGGNVKKDAVLLDRTNLVVHRDGSRYAVLHQYTIHEQLWRALTQRLLQGRRQQLAALDCSSFDTGSGDIKGYDLSHTPADTQKECCTACLGDPGCGGFVYSGFRKHCWLKRPAGARTLARPGDDIVCGVRKPGPASPGVL